jgi:hypothetical protein
MVRQLQGHIGGTSARDLPGDADNCRDLARTSSGRSAASIEVRRTQEQDSAYKPKRSLHPTRTPRPCVSAMAQVKA